MKVRFLIDADLPRALFQGLIRRSSSLDVVRVHQVGLASAADAEILDFAAKDERITISRDKATMLDVAAARLQRGESMPGSLLVRPDYVRRHGFGLREVIDDLVLIAECTDAEKWLNLIEFLPFSE